MKMVTIYKNTDTIRACACDVVYYEGHGWSTTPPEAAGPAPTKPKTGKRAASQEAE